MDKRKKNKGKAVTGAIGLVFVFTFLGKLLGVVREMLQANYFGTSGEADLFSAAYNSTLYLFMIACYAFAIAAVPVLTAQFAKSREDGFRASDNLITWTFLITLLGVGAYYLVSCTPLLTALWPGVDADRLLTYFRIMALGLPVASVTYVLVGVFQATDHYELHGLMFLPYNLFLSLYLLLVKDSKGMMGLGIACTAGWLIMLAMSVPYAKKEQYHYHPRLERKTGYVLPFFRTAAVGILTTSIFLFCYLMDTSAVSSLGAGLVSSYYYADKLFTPIITTVIYSISSVMFPKFNQQYDPSKKKEYLSFVWNVTENTLLVVLPVCAMMCVFGTNIIRVLFENGSFDANASAVTGNIFMRYGLGMAAFCILDLLNRAYYTMKKTLTPLLINGGILVLNLMLNAQMKTTTGIALSTSIALTAGAVGMILPLFHKTGAFRFAAVGKGLAATGLMAAVMALLQNWLVNGTEEKVMLVIKCGGIGVVGCGVYLAASLLLRQQAVKDAVTKILSKRS